MTATTPSRIDAARAEMEDILAALNVKAINLADLTRLTYGHPDELANQLALVDEDMMALRARAQDWKASARRYLALSKSADARKAARAARLRAEADAIDGGAK